MHVRTASTDYSRDAYRTPNESSMSTSRAPATLKRILVGGALVAALAAAGCTSSTGGASADYCRENPYASGCNEGHPVESDADRIADEQRQRDTETLRQACRDLGGDC